MGLNLETREDSPGNGLANLLVVLEHMDDSERTGREHRKLECSSGSVSDKFARKTSAIELDQWWRLMHRTATSVEMVTSTVERPRRQMVRHASEPLHRVQVAGSHCGQFGQKNLEMVTLGMSTNPRVLLKIG